MAGAIIVPGSPGRSYRVFGATSGGGPTWTTVWSNALTDGDEPNWGNTVFVNSIDHILLGAATGQTCRLTLRFATLSSGRTADIYFAQQGAGDVYDFNTTPAHVLFGGTSITGDGTTLNYVSDPFTLPETYDNSKNYVVAADFQNGSGSPSLPGGTTGANQGHLRYSASVPDAATVNKSGYLSDGDAVFRMVAKIEIST